MSPDLLQTRQRLEAKIEDLIGLLDLLDGDPDFEPYLAGFDHAFRGGSPDDREGADDSNMPGLGEGDDSDLEPSCGWTLNGAHGYGNEEEEPNGDEQDCSHSEDEWSPAGGSLVLDGSGVDIANALVKGLPTFWDRPTMKSLIAGGVDPNRSEIERMRR